MVELDGLAAALESVALPAPRLVLAATGAQRPGLDAIWISRISGEDWTGWSGIGQPVGGALHLRPALELFAIGEADGAVWHRRQSQPGGSWADWASLGHQGGGFAEVTVAPGADDRLVLFATEQPGQPDPFSATGLWQCAQLTPGGDWSPWQDRSDLLNTGPDTPIEGPVLVLGEQSWLRLLTRASGGADIYEAIQVKADSTAVDAWAITILEFHPV